MRMLDVSRIEVPRARNTTSPRPSSIEKSLLLALRPGRNAKSSDFSIELGRGDVVLRARGTSMRLTSSIRIDAQGGDGGSGGDGGRGGSGGFGSPSGSDGR